MRKRKVLLVFISALLLPALFSFTTCTAERLVSLDSLPIVYIAPSEVTAAVGETLTINISISNVVDLYGWTGGIAFNPNVLECLSFEEGPFLKQAGLTHIMPATINNTLGIIYPRASCCVLGDGPGVNGSGTLAYVTFRVKDVGVSELLLNYMYKGKQCSIELCDCTSLDPIPFNLIEGHFEAYIDDISPTVSITNLEADAVIAGTSVTVEWNGTDIGSGIKHYSLFLNDAFIANTPSTSYIFPSLTEGLNNVTVVAYDKVDNFGSAQIDITVDLTPPMVGITVPSNRDYLNGVVLVNVTGNDDNFDGMELYIDEALAATFNTAGTHTYAWNTTEYTDGTYKLTIKAQDKAGHLTVTEVTWGDGTFSVNVDNTPPTVLITSPSDAAELAGTVTIGFTTSDAQLTNALLFIDNTVVDVTGKTSYNWDTTSFSDGLHTIKIVAYDRAGNAKQAQITVKTNNFQGVRQEAYIAGISTGLIIGATLGLIAGAIIAFAKKRP